MKIDWDNKPEWADVWIEDLTLPGWSCWHRYCKDTNRYYDVGGGYYLANYKDIAIHYPPETRAHWRGPEEGFPPVGIEVEVNHHEYGWTPADTVGPYGDYMVCSPNGGGFYGYDLHEIRPKKSDKEKWLDAAGDLLNNMQPQEDFLSALYDAMILGEIPIPKKESTNEPTV